MGMPYPYVGAGPGGEFCGCMAIICWPLTISICFVSPICIQGSSVRGWGFVCSGSEAGSYSRLMDFVYHSSLGL